MAVTSVMAGMIYLLRNQRFNEREREAGTNFPMYHNYIVIGTVNRDEPGQSKHLAQVMLITSMRERTIENEVPILLGNGQISYVVPYNIYSVPLSEIASAKFHGCVADDIVTREGFISLLVQMYEKSLHLRMDDTYSATIEGLYKDYCRKFFEKYNNVREYREKYENPHTDKMYYAYHNKPEKVVAVENVSGEIVNTEEVFKPDIVNEIEVEETVTKTIRRRSTRKPSLTEDEKKALKSLEDAPRTYELWTDSQLLILLNAVEHHTKKEIMDNCNRWGSYESLQGAINRAEDVYMNR